MAANCAHVNGFCPDAILARHRHAPYWIGAGFVAAGATWPGTGHAPLTGVQYALEVLALWCFVPIVMAAIWWRYLVCHEWTLSLTHAALTAISVVGAWSFKQLAGATLARISAPLWVIPGMDQPTPQVFRTRAADARPLPTSARHGIALAVAAALLAGVSSVCTNVVGWPGANLRDAEVSVVPSDLVRTDLKSSTAEQRQRIRGARLSFRDLRNADAQGAVFVYADLRGANLRSADFTGADFRWADLSGADLSAAVLKRADLRNAKRDGAILVGTDTTDVRW
jgi:hypothetical protein